ncbi:MAG: MBL fold metallo-hydrolase [Propionibacteriales bacterium]|nr:MBL fold metallo-hydrolase [Propionibacteriales bacterium]
MRLTIIGCSGSFPGPDSPASCYLVEAPYDGATFRLLLDLGSGALGALQRHTSLRSIDAVALSHLHADHCLDLCGFYVVRRYHPLGPWPPLPVFGPPRSFQRLSRAYDLEPNPGLREEFTFHTYPAGDFKVGPFTVSAVLVDHPATAYAIRVSVGERSLVYSGDTAPCGSLQRLAKGCDLLLAEASFADGEDNPPHLHMTGRQAAEIADAAGVGRLLLTHIPPWHSREAILAEARPHYRGETTLALPDQSYDV